jgi:hypothetical protein
MQLTPPDLGPALGMTPTIEEPRGHDVARLEFLVHQAEDLLEIREYRASELINQERTTGVQQGVRGAENPLSDRSRHRGIGNPGDHVIGVGQASLFQDDIGFLGGPMDDMEPVIRDRSPKVMDKLSIGLDRHQGAVRPQPPQDLAGKCAHSRTVLDHYPGARPIDLTKQMIHQIPRAGDQGAEHLRVLQEIAAEQEKLLRTAGSWL